MYKTPYLTAVFPLSETVFFPKTTLPLNIFEPKYLKMLEDSLKDNLPIALCPKSLGNKDSFDGVVCTIGMPIVLQENEDGSKLIMLQAQDKVILHERLQKIPYIKYNCVVVPEDNKLLSENLFRVNRLKIELKNWVNSNSQSSEHQQSFFSKMGHNTQLINYACSFLVKDPRRQQVLLKSSDINQRLDLVLQLIDETSFSPQASL